MVTPTDPARELADICMSLSTKVQISGDQYLSRCFDVPAWSTEFYQIIFSISKRADELIAILPELELDEDYRADAVGHIEQIKKAFGPDGLRNPWSHAIEHFMSPANVGPLKILSALVRGHYAYPKLSDTEAAEIIAMVDDLLKWLKEANLAERDFIRAAIIEGLEQFRFRLQRIGWLGWGVALESLRQVIGAYLALERGTPDLATAPDADAVLRKTVACVKGILQKVQKFRETAGDVAFMVLAYEQVTQVVQGKTGIAGLLTHLGSS